MYPERLWIEEKTFCNVFPFHVVFDEAVSCPFFLGMGVGEKSEKEVGGDLPVTEKFPEIWPGRTTDFVFLLWG